MISDYQIQPNSRRCSITGRELKPGETYFSVLLDEAGRFVRREYSREAWQGPPEGAFSFWCGKVPAREQDRRPPVDDDMLLDCFTRLEGQNEPARVNFRYVLALLLMRRKRLKFEDADTQNGREVLRLRCVQTKAIHEVINPALSDEETQVVQEEVFKVLGWQ
jgi:hypothetical protein